MAPAKVRYRLEATLDGQTGAEALLVDADGGAQHLVTSDTRATLLFLLAKARLDPFDASEGWCADVELGVGIWGRNGGEDPRRLYVLLHRVRKELRKAGFDPWFIEKRKHATRILLTDVEIR